jgi:hypothetical protein
MAVPGLICRNRLPQQFLATPMQLYLGANWQEQGNSAMGQHAMGEPLLHVGWHLCFEHLLGAFPAGLQ